MSETKSVQIPPLPEGTRLVWVVEFESWSGRPSGIVRPTALVKETPKGFVGHQCYGYMDKGGWQKPTTHMNTTHCVFETQDAATDYCTDWYKKKLAECEGRRGMWLEPTT